ncbi:MAG: GatB/YqeY domain-containing protein [Gammaproteobacteria bacterium]|nr:GatB/YqeY domain-containing protein [Gammaproteobacteria bacterium]
MPESPLKKEISEAMKSAMRAKDKTRLGAIRLALAEIKRIEVDERSDPDDPRIISVLDKMIKQRRESIKHFESANRDELVAQEQVEIDILKEFLPEAISEEELDTLIGEAMSSSGAEGMRDMGKVMAILKPQVVGRADMSLVSNKIKSALS